MLYSVIISIVLILDQWLKYWVTLNIGLSGDTITLLPGVLDIVYVQNKGAAFGLLSGSPMAKWIFAGVAVVFTVLIIVAIARRWFPARFSNWCMVLVAAGAISNCIDRIANGYVIDMLKLGFINFAVFNIADVFVTLGCLLFIVSLFFGGKKEKRAKSEKVSEPVRDKTEDASEGEKKLRIRKIASEKREAISESFDFFEKTSEEETERRMADDEEFWTKLKFATGKGERSVSVSLPRTPEPEPVKSPEPARTAEPAPKVSDDAFDLSSLNAGEDSFDLDSILNEFRDE